jgi:hypothetical protein
VRNDKNSPDTGDSEAGALLAITANTPCKVIQPRLPDGCTAVWVGRSILEVDINCRPRAESGERREIVVRCCEGTTRCWLAVVGCWALEGACYQDRPRRFLLRAGREMIELRLE